MTDRPAQRAFRHRARGVRRCAVRRLRRAGVAARQPQARPARAGARASRTRRCSPRVECSRSSRSRASPNQRAFSADDLRLLQSLANEAALALDRLRSSAALAKALERERLISRIAARFRTQLDLDTVLSVAVEETARALGAQRAFVRIGEPRREHADRRGVGRERAGAARCRARRRCRCRASRSANGEPSRSTTSRTIRRSRLSRRSRGDARDRHPLRARDADRRVRRGDRRLRAAPHDGRVTGPRPTSPSPRPWRARPAWPCASRGSSASARSRCASRRACFGAAQNVTSELEVETVLQRLVDELAALLGLDAADVYLYDERRGMLRCAAVHGLPDDLVGFEFPAEEGAAAEAVQTRQSGHHARPRCGRGHSRTTRTAGSRAAIFAPIVGSGETRGVLGAARARGAALRRARHRRHRSLRLARGARAAERRDVRGAVAAGARAAGLLQHRDRPRRAALADRDARRGRAGGGRGTRRRFHGRADAAERRRARACRLVRAAAVVRGRLGGRPPSGRARAVALRGRGPCHRRAVARRRHALRPANGRRSPKRRAAARCSPCPSSRRARSATASCSSASRRSGASPTTTSSSRSSSRTSPAARSAAATSTSRSGAPARSRSSSRVRAACSPPSSTPTRCSRRSFSTRRRCSVATPARSGSSKATSSCSRPRAARAWRSSSGRGCR